MGDVTRILSQIEEGDGQAAEKLLPLVYDELRRLAAAKMSQENPGQTLQATALVHEAYIRLVDVEKVQHWNTWNGASLIEQSPIFPWSRVPFLERSPVFPWSEVPFLGGVPFAVAKRSAGPRRSSVPVLSCEP